MRNARPPACESCGFRVAANPRQNCADKKGVAMLTTDRRSAPTIVALLLILTIPGLPLSKWENEFAGVSHLVGYEVIWWILTFSVLFYVRRVESRPLSSIGFRSVSLKDLLIGLGAGIVMTAGLAGIYYGVLPALHL